MFASPRRLISVSSRLVKKMWSLLQTWWCVYKVRLTKIPRRSFPPCYKSHLYRVTCSDWNISTYLHTPILTFSTGAKFQNYLRGKSFFFIWQWQITGQPQPPPKCQLPPQPTYNITILCGHLSRSSLFPILLFVGIYHHSLAFFSYISPGPSISSLRLVHSSHLFRPMPIHLRAAEAHSTPCFVGPSITTDCRPNRSGRKKEAMI